MDEEDLHTIISFISWMQRTGRSDEDPEPLGTLSGGVRYKTLDGTLPLAANL